MITKYVFIQTVFLYFFTATLSEKLNKYICKYYCSFLYYLTLSSLLAKDVELGSSSHKTIR